MNSLEKIKFLTDSACDIPEQTALEYGIEVLSIPITMDGKGYLERKDFTSDEFYQMLLEAKAIPTTSHITSLEFSSQYKKALDEGYTHVVVTTINSKGSSMYDAANVAKGLFYDDHPEAADKLTIYVVDSKLYTLPYSYAQQEAAKMARAGTPCAEIVDFLVDFFSRVKIYFAVYSLEFAKKSGRINCAAAFVGDVLGLRPIIEIVDGEMNIIDKVRGDKNVVPKLVDYAVKNRIKGTPMLTLRALTDDVGEQLNTMLEEKTGETTLGLFKVGACITINAGPRLAGVMILEEKRSPK